MLTEADIKRLEKIHGAYDETYATGTLDRMLGLADAARDSLEKTWSAPLPPYDQAGLTRTYPDIQSADQAHAAHDMLEKLRQNSFRNPDAPPEQVIAAVTRGMKSDEIVRLPDTLRVELVLAMSGNIATEAEQNDHARLNEQRMRLLTGYDHEQIQKMAPIQTDGRRTVSFSPALANWQVGREIEYMKKESFLFRDNPDLREIRERWQESPAAVSAGDKLKLLTQIHAVQAEAYGYAPGLIVRENIPGVKAAAEDRKFADTPGGLIAVNPQEFTGMTYSEGKTAILHEGDHLAQFSWMHQFDQLPANDPRRDFVRRQAAFEMTETVGPATGVFGLSVEGMILYFSRPNETHAYLLHDPGRTNSPPELQQTTLPYTQKPEHLPGL